MRSLGSYGSELIVENFRERFFHIWTIATYIRTYRSFQCMPPMSSFCEGILGFTGVWGRDHTITTLDAHPMAPRMDVATIGRSLSTWRFSLSLLSEVPTQFHLCHKKVQFYPEERGYTGGFNGRDNYYPRDDYWFGGYRYKLELSSQTVFIICCLLIGLLQCPLLRTKLLRKTTKARIQKRGKTRIIIMIKVHRRDGK